MIFDGSRWLGGLLALGQPPDDVVVRALAISCLKVGTLWVLGQLLDAPEVLEDPDWSSPFDRWFGNLATRCSGDSGSSRLVIFR